MQFQRIYDHLDLFLKPNKVLALFGPRQVGKTTLVKNFLASTRFTYRIDSGDDIRAQEIYGSRDLKNIVGFVKPYELIIIDEAQKIPFIGIGLKLIVDHVPGIRVIVTGSSSFELSGQIGEPLTGRKITLQLFPLSHLELKKHHNAYEINQKLEEYLIYGKYPEVVVAQQHHEKKNILNEITGSNLLKDILELEKVKNSKILLDLLRLLALQIGHEVSLSEIGRQLQIDTKTVARYLDLFEKSFIIFNLRGFSRNLRKEVTKKSKYYFYDTGVRNSIIANFNPLNIRNDIGPLWENFLVMERLKKQSYHNIFSNNYFWRTWDQKEIDFVEERDGKLFGYEFKWNTKNTKPPREWSEQYKNSSFEVVTRENYLDFIM